MDHPRQLMLFTQRVWDWRDPQWLRGVTFGPPVDLAVSGIPFEQVIDPDLQTRLGTRNIQARQFDVTSSLSAPPGEAWYAIAENQTLAPEFAMLFDQVQPLAEGRTIVENPPYRLYRFNLARRVEQAAQRSIQVAQAVTLPVKFGEAAEPDRVMICARSRSFDVSYLLACGRAASSRHCKCSCTC